MIFSSSYLEKAVDELSKLPGIGKKTALRLALYLLRQPLHEVEAFGEAVVKMRREIHFCVRCHNITDTDICQICSNPRRDEKLICVVQDIRDIMAIENTGQYQGTYHVLGSVISPIDGIGPGDINAQSLFDRVKRDEAREVILALPATVEGDTTSYYVYKSLRDTSALVTTLSRGVAIGDDIEFTDEVTLGRSILNRQPYSEG